MFLEYETPFAPQETKAADTRIFLTSLLSTSDWTVPLDWNNASNSIEVIGGGGGGDGDTNSGNGGGGGGAYARINNATLTPGVIVDIQVGNGGVADTNGSDTYLCNSVDNCTSIGDTAVIVGAENGAAGAGATGGAGGATSTSVGTIKYKGGNGGDGDTTGDLGGGGGGAAGPLGNGQNGGAITTAGTSNGGGGGGGGGGGSATTGSSGAAAGANGGLGYLGTGGGAGCSGTCAGGNATSSAGGGGGGDNGGAGGNGSSSVHWGANPDYGPGGGGGGCGDNGTGTGGAGGRYGAGGGGCEATGGSGGQGVIVITYTPVSPSTAPGTPTYTDVDANTLTVNWTAATSSDYYKLERSTSGISFAQISTTTNLTYNDTGLTQTTYYYRVRGTNGSGDGPYSASSSVTTPDPYLTQDQYRWFENATSAVSMMTPPLGAGTAVGSGWLGSTSTIESSDDVRVNVNMAIGGTTSYLTITNFGFSIPTGATILGIKAEIEKSYLLLSGSPGIYDNSVRIVKNGSVGSVDKDNGSGWLEQSSEAYSTYGSSSESWGESWTAEDINNSGFGVAIKASEDGGGSATVNVDHARITVYYQTPATGQSLAPENTAATGIASGTVVRLRVNVSATSTTQAAGTIYKLQFSTATSSGWADVGDTASTSIWRGYDNAGVSDGASVTNFQLSNSNIFESYEEQNNSTGTPNALTVTSTVTGRNWTRATSSANWAGREFPVSLIYDNKMWVLGGTTGTRKNDVWYSTNGINWTLATSSANWSARTAHASLVHDNKMWILGGSDGSAKNDVWYSTNGINWTQATSGANWVARTYSASLVYDNKMWVMGGANSGGAVLNDVWYSTNGITWTQATSGANWSARAEHSVIVYDNKMWVIGGDSGGGNIHNDVWYSTNGINWTQATANAGWSDRWNPGLTVYDNKIWLTGGATWTGFLTTYNDVWYSTSGVTWTQATATAPWAVRAGHSSVVYDGKIWLIGGINSSTYLNDVWSSAGNGVGEWDWVLQHNGATASTTYYFRMVESDGTVLDSYDRWPTLTTATSSEEEEPLLPGTPGTPTYTSIASSSLTVNWTTGGDTDYFKLERATSSGNGPFTQITTTTLTSYANTALTTSTTYWYRVRGTNTEGDGSYSASSSVNTLSGGYKASGTLTSLIIDTQVAGGVSPNSLYWEGNYPVGTTVKFQFAASDSGGGPWNYNGWNNSTNSCDANSYYEPSGPNVPIEIKAVCHKNKRYIRYKIYLATTDSTVTPRVDRVILNYAR